MPIYKFGGFWRRSVAYMIDGFIIAIVLFVLMMVAGIAYLAGAMTGDGRAIMAKIADPEQIASYTLWIWLFSLFINIAYFTYFHGSTGRTPGKILLGLQVVTVEGGPLNLGIAFLRSVGYLVSSLVFCLGYFWIGFDKKKQGWHDKIAGTVVIIREPEGNTVGISIPDSSAAPPVKLSAVEPSGVVLQAGGQTPQSPSGEETAKPNDQKIP